MRWRIGTRLAASFALLVGVILLAHSLALYLATSYSLETQFRRDMVHEARWIAEVVRAHERDGKLATLSADMQNLDADVRVLELNGRVLFDSGGVDWSAHPWKPAAADAASPSWQRLKIAGVINDLLFDVVALPHEKPLAVEMLASHRDVAQIKGTFSFWIERLVPVAMTLAVVVGFLFARRALAPIDVIRRKADGITAANLRERLPVPAQKDELYYLTETLNRLLARIDQGFSETRRFTQDASHELRIPVTVLKAALDVAARRERTKEEYQALIGELSEEVNGLAALVDDLLTLSRADAGEKRPAPQRVRLDLFLADVVAAAAALNAGKVRLQFEAGPEREATVDPDGLKRALLNLLHNAIKFTPAGGTVVLAARAEEGGVAITVTDSGPGIAPQDQERIFDRFYRTDEARSRDAGGTGLGLAIARSLVAAQGGTLTVASAPGQGSVFRLFLPDRTP